MAQAELDRIRGAKPSRVVRSGDTAFSGLNNADVREIVAGATSCDRSGDRWTVVGVITGEFGTERYALQILWDGTPRGILNVIGAAPLEDRHG